jgi:predicted nuclease with TOPRIM domain
MKYVTIPIAFIILAACLFTGCGVSKESYDAVAKQANDLRDQLSAMETELTTTQESLNQSNADLATAQESLNTVTADRDAILEELHDAETDLSTAQDQLDSANSQIATLQSQLDALESADSQIAALQDQVTTLQGQVNQFQEITDLSLYTIELDAEIIYQAPNIYENIVSFTADYAGYIVVTGTSSSFNTYIRVDDSFNGYPYGEYLHHFGTGTTLKIPVLPGKITVYLSNTSAVGISATMTVMYYY